MKTIAHVSLKVEASFELPAVKSGEAGRLPVGITDTGKIRLGGASRLPVKTADAGKIRLGGASRLSVKTA